MTTAKEFIAFPSEVKTVTFKDLESGQPIVATVVETDGKMTLRLDLPAGLSVQSVGLLEDICGKFYSAYRERPAKLYELV